MLNAIKHLATLSKNEKNINSSRGPLFKNMSRMTDLADDVKQIEEWK